MWRQIWYMLCSKRAAWCGVWPVASAGSEGTHVPALLSAIQCGESSSLIAVGVATVAWHGGCSGGCCVGTVVVLVRRCVICGGLFWFGHVRCAALLSAWGALSGCVLGGVCGMVCRKMMSC